MFYPLQSITSHPTQGDLHDPGDWTNTSSTEDLPRTTRVREHSSSDDIPSLMKSAVNTEIKRSSSGVSGVSGVSPNGVGSKTEMVTPVYSRQVCVLCFSFFNLSHLFVSLLIFLKRSLIGMKLYRALNIFFFLMLSLMMNDTYFDKFSNFV